MGYHLVITKFMIIIFINILVELLFLVLGGYFLMMIFLLGIANMLVVTFAFKKENRRQKALLSLILALLLTAIPILFACAYGDAGAVAFMIIFTSFFVAIPLLLFCGLTFLRNIKT